MANFATLSSVLAGRAIRVKPDACSSLFAAATVMDGKAPTDTLTAAISIAHNMAYKPAMASFRAIGRVLSCAAGQTPARNAVHALSEFRTERVGLAAQVLRWRQRRRRQRSCSTARATPGAATISSSGGRGTTIYGTAICRSSLSDGRPLSPTTTGFTGGGMLGPGFGTAIIFNDRVWVTSTSGQTISLFDKTGKPLSPPEGYNFGGKLRTMQGIIVTPNGDVWALDFGDDKVVYMPKGDPSEAKFYCQSTNGQPNKDSPCKLNGPFGLAIDQQDRIWITNAIGDTVTRFPESDPSKVEVFPTGGGSGKGMAIDSQGNAGSPIPQAPD